MQLRIDFVIASLLVFAMPPGYHVTTFPSVLFYHREASEEGGL